MKHGKKYAEALKVYDRQNLYDMAEAVEIVKKTAIAKFDETIEAHIRTGCDGRHADQQVRGAVVLPNGTGKSVRVLVFAKSAKAEEAKAAGADYVGEMELVTKIQKENWFDFDVVVSAVSAVSLARKASCRTRRPEQLPWMSLRQSRKLKPVRSSIVLTRATSSTARSARLPSQKSSFPRILRLSLISLSRFARQLLRVSI